MKVLAINGSPHTQGNTRIALEEMAKVLEKEEISTEIIDVGHLLLHGCIGCNHCAAAEDHHCVFNDDILNPTVDRLREADGFILGSPTYYGGIAGTMKCFLDRVFYTSSQYFRYKVATAVAVVRRAGGEDVVRQLHHYLSLAEVLVPPSAYWTVAYGTMPGEVLKDGEGIRTLRENARAMAWLLRAAQAGRKEVPVPPEAPEVRTNFIR